MAETGLNQNYFRHYDPAVGRYVESDPVGIDAGVNTYLYSLANPVSHFDATGLETMPDSGRPTSYPKCFQWPNFLISPRPGVAARRNVRKPVKSSPLPAIRIAGRTSYQ